MNRTASPRILLGFFVACGTAWPEVPQLPFSGALGATLGAGSVTGWERHGGGNPAALGRPGFGVAMTGYAPFGLENLHVAEVSVVRDAPRWGGSMRYRGVFDRMAAPAGGASEAALQAAVRVSSRTVLGTSLAHAADVFGARMAFGGGGLWRPHRALGLGAFHEAWLLSAAHGSRSGLGMDVGGRLGPGSVWRVAAETHWRDDGFREDRFGAGVRLHPLLSVYVGFAPLHRSIGVGVRFGMGDWEGHSALRRHALLGGTSIQGIRWWKDLE